MPGHTITILPVAAAFALMASVSAGTTYYVKGTCGNDAWSGTSPDCTAPHGPKATIQAAINVASDGDEILVWPHVYGERIDFLGKAVALRSQAGPQGTVIDGQGTGTVVTCFSGEGPETVLEGFTITGGLAEQGGGMFNLGSSPTVRNCIFTGNEAEIAGAMRNRYDSSPFIDGCSFVDNDAALAGGGVINSEGQPVFRDCLFLGNDGQMGIGAAANLNGDGGIPTFVNCRFIQNHAGWVAGAVDDGAGAAFVNCVFSRNVTEGPPNELGALTTVHGQPLLVNCTFSGNTGTGLSNIYYAEITVRNSIVWGNSAGSIDGGGNFAYCDVEGGRPGPGNIDADPLFVQPGTDNVRLAAGSPCLNAGSNAELPPDELDLDGDGNTSEPLPVDLDGNPRIIDEIVDMGAYEGEFDQEEAAAGASDFDHGEFVVLIPGGGDLNPLENALVIAVNTSGPDDATFIVSEFEGNVYPGAGGYSELSSILGIETSLADGEYRATVFIPLDASSSDGFVPAGVNITCFDPGAGNWALGVAGNLANSPGFDGPVGDRVLSLEGGPWNVSNELGDYGAYWDPALGQGFAWAVVDSAGDFGLGEALCPADCHQTPDGAVDVTDFLALLSSWGEASVGGPCDINADGVVGVEDFLALLDSWGVCPLPAMPVAAGADGGARFSFPSTAPIRSADIDGDGSVGRDDFWTLRSSWGPGGGHGDADLNADGRVDARDLLALLADWR
ncbi:MAG: GC-type dockerin domain-anchored protein [Planctomycetota bacterium]|jgi:hypothetical protein